MASGRATRRRIALITLVLALLPTLTFARVVAFEFVHDDTYEVVRNDSLRAPLIPTLRSVLRATAHAQGIPNATRPATIASLALDYRVFGLRPPGFHVHSLLLHALASVAAGFTAFALTRRARIALVAGLVFGLAPIHAEAVAGISNRDELIAAGATLIALCAIAWPRAGPLPLAAELGIAAVWLIGLGARESALALLPLVLASWSILRPPRADLRHRESLVFTLLGVLIIWINWRFAAHLGGDGIPRIPQRDLWTIVCDTARFEVRAVGQSLWPLRSTPEYSREPTAGPAWLLALLGIVAATFALARRRTTRIPALGVAFALLAPLPASPLFGPVSPRADRYLYLAVFGGALIWGFLADRVARHLPRRWTELGLAGFVVLLIIACQRAIAPWADERALWTRAVADAPDSPRAWTALSRVHRLAGEIDAADSSVDRAILLDPGYVPARVTRAHNALARGDIEIAQRELRTIENLGGGAHPGFARARLCSTLAPFEARDCITK